MAILAITISTHFPQFVIETHEGNDDIKRGTEDNKVSENNGQACC